MDLSYLLDFHIAYTIIIVLLALKYGDWKNWQLYYPTILFYAVVDFSYALVCYNFPLWQLQSPLLKTTGSDLVLTLIAAPAAITIYLTYLDKILQKNKTFIPLYIAIWVAVQTIAEWIAYRLGFTSYYNNWNIWVSLLFNCVMYSILGVHFKRPLLAILLTFIAAILVLVYFHVPLSTMK